MGSEEAGGQGIRKRMTKVVSLVDVFSHSRRHGSVEEDVITEVNCHI